ncbi:DUF3553 domain-containing protein [Paenibacillus sp.]|jgi:hypothetical protein|uniref:DUF3553 domain-containing protein n=1 Tax=Paenibacillus sp. TaxID=58172 RepID=UPI00282764EA|nr:DUF3553 domain-containing protein [Paenibacillus sp.]MDR0269621.1 DUF3553 domain-containing protein [Paenibacillus sp.]
MNKQEHFISSDKLLAWIESELTKEYPESVNQYVDGRETVLEILKHRIEQRIFEPDHITLPTLKPGDKVRHKENKAWGIGNVHYYYKDETTVLCAFPDLRPGFRTKYIPVSELEVTHE